ncbi:anti-sigma factor [Sporosarcina sp. Marseille-Q4063]|uniref:anti-sigma factor n=1 Tax=Sporosarcina sp. Marseille-Q4063 TaxID=2810514 RepID=UPI001BAF75FD|nr:anti-sigma factor [Sporosarcina sp. Marseille-Q4063]QUW21983.1 anti-sigma factor [Sporosarcina sp. Marseille-Q4063]
MNNDKKENQEQFSSSDDALQNEVQGVEKKVWEAMHFDFEIVDEPTGLKEDVLNFAFAQDAQNETLWERVRSYFQKVGTQFTPLTASLSITMLFSIIFLATQLIQNPTEGFNEIASSMTLNAAEGDPGEVYGHAYLINKNGNEELVINVSGFPQTEGKEVYQVWLIDNSNRQSAGVFKPDKEGNGILTVNMSKYNAFNNIGITLEPDADGKQPRGKKIVGTS